ncbi:MAG: F0F1 ATP synthase subunit gamma [Methylococcales bacterium]|nr:F0F1 ATP synthase subunit gamma [Methylococcales bacterium]
MSQSRDLHLHITQMQEIRSILNAMKNLALIEVHKLTRLQAMQGQAVANIEHAALDFLDFYPIATVTAVTPINILVGAERGFCGDFNDQLIHTALSDNSPHIITIGDRLGNRAADSPLDVIASIDGANVSEEVPTIINKLIDTLGSDTLKTKLLATHPFQVTVVYHDATPGQITRRQILPPFPRQTSKRQPYRIPPLLNLMPTAFYASLLEQYLLAVFYDIFYRSFMAESQQRLQHLEGAIKHLDDETSNLHRKAQIYRQEEITEEIEVILLNSEIN